ncbi:TPA: hypothetical protein DDW35_11890, partial [Candidatus Sumerlaeota bacterium]|nr:hypothetical protein [Candidatus Sumerlaeota bacterium]
MLRRPLHAWIIFTVCLLIGAGVMGWITRAALQLAKTEGEARNNAALEENVRLALWRMESALAPLIAQESARPYYLYSQYYSGYYHGKDGAGKVRIPSPLALQNPPFTLLHFQIAPSGQITSPQIANGSARPDGPETERTCRRSQQELLHLQSILKYPTLLERLEEVENAMPIPT